MLCCSYELPLSLTSSPSLCFTLALTFIAASPASSIARARSKQRAWSASARAAYVCIWEMVISVYRDERGYRRGGQKQGSYLKSSSMHSSWPCDLCSINGIPPSWSTILGSASASKIRLTDHSCLTFDCSNKKTSPIISICIYQCLHTVHQIIIKSFSYSRSAAHLGPLHIL